MLDPQPLLVGTGALAIALGALRIWNIGKRERGLPPGPPTTPILGNLPSLPKSHSYLKFNEWSQEYGEIYSVKKFNDTIIILSSPRAIYYIMEKKGALTMDRPYKYISEMLSNSMALALARYGSNWRGGRRAAMEILKPASCAKHLPIQLAESSQLMYDFLKTPEDAFNHIERYSFSVINSVMFGIRTPQITSPALQKLFLTIRKMSKLYEPGATPPLEMLPILTYVPERWARWKRETRELRALQRDLFFGLLKDSEEREKSGQGNGCHMEWVRSKAEDYHLTREMVGYVGGSMLNAGSTTTASFLQFLVLLMIENPEVQAKARDELDRVVGSDRLPDLDDVPNLPYIQAIIQEVHRYRPILPLALPHRCMKDIMYEDYFIPANSTLMVNLYGLYRDPTFFDHPETFDPNRYLVHSLGFKKGIDIDQDEDIFKRFNTMGFGFGRRVCPGLHLASNSISLNASRMLWGFEFSDSVKLTDGSPADSSYFSSGATNDPRPFKCTIHPRSLKHEQVIKAAFVHSTPTFQRFECELSEEDRAYVNQSRAEIA